MAQTDQSKGNVPVNRLVGYLDQTNPRGEWKLSHLSEEDCSDLTTPSPCHYGSFGPANVAEETELGIESPNWTKLAQKLVERLSLDNRVQVVEKELKEISTRLMRIESLFERVLEKSACVPISTFAPEPFEVIRDFSVVVQPEQDSFVATMFDANISSCGETPEEAVANVKDLILMIFKGFEHEDDSELGPAMIRQKHALLSLLRRK